MNIVNIILVGSGGFAGSVARYLTTMAVDRTLHGALPFGTLTVNIAGSFLLGVITGFITTRPDASQEQWRLLLATGFCGGFTTFSAFAVENASLLDQKLASTALLYTLLSVAGGLVAVWLGFTVSRTIF